MKISISIDLLRLIIMSVIDRSNAKIIKYTQVSFLHTLYPEISKMKIIHREFHLHHHFFPLPLSDKSTS